MSVQKKYDRIQAARVQFNDKQRKFEAYAEAFATDVTDKQDVTERVAARESLVEAMEATDDEFAAYSDTFNDDLARLHEDIEAETALFKQVADRFDAYASVFEADVKKKQDVTHLLEAIDDLSVDMAATEDVFVSYSEVFADDVTTMQDISALQNAIVALQEAFKNVTASFEAYSTAFNTDVAGFHEAVADQRDAFTQATEVFESYSAAFDTGVTGFHESVADQRNAFTQTADAFDAYEREFHEEGVQSVLDAITAFQETIEAFRTEFDLTKAEFAAYTQEFYGIDNMATVSKSVDDAEDESESADNVAIEAEATGQDESVAEDSIPIDVSTDESPAAGVEANEDPGEAGGVTTESEEDAEPTEDKIIETDHSDSTGVDPVADGLVQCLICGEYYQAITEPHLQTHDMTIQDYRDEYGEDVPLRPDDDK